MLISKPDTRINFTCLCCVYLQPMDLVNKLVISLAIKISFALLCSLVLVGSDSQRDVSILHLRYNDEFNIRWRVWFVVMTLKNKYEAFAWWPPSRFLILCTKWWIQQLDDESERSNRPWGISTRHLPDRLYISVLPCKVMNSTIRWRVWKVDSTLRSKYEAFAWYHGVLYFFSVMKRE